MITTPVLTPLELKIMQILWRIEKGFVKDILEHWDEQPAPAYNTVSTIIRILQDQKGLVGHVAHGRTHEYFPKISKDAYQRSFLRNTLSKLFDDSPASLLSALLDDESIDQNELEELKKLL